MHPHITQVSSAIALPGDGRALAPVPAITSGLVLLVVGLFVCLRILSYGVTMLLNSFGIDCTRSTRFNGLRCATRTSGDFNPCLIARS